MSRVDTRMCVVKEQRKMMNWSETRISKEFLLKKHKRFYALFFFVILYHK